MSTTNVWTGVFNDREIACAKDTLAQLQPRPVYVTAERAAKHLYEVLREPEPKVLWLPSPVACANEMHKQNGSLVWWESRKKTFRKRPLSYASKAERRALARIVRESMQADTRIQEGLWWYRDAQFPMRWGTRNKNSHLAELSQIFQRYTSARNLRFAIAKQAIYSVMGEDESKAPQIRTEAWKELYLSAHFAFLDRGIVTLSQPPTEVNRDANGRFHAEIGPAVRYSDGARLWAWHGVQVPKRLIQFPEKLDIWEIRQERNAEVRRVMMERYGLDRFLKDTQSTLMNKGKLGKLYRVEYDDRTWAQFVVVTNSTPEKDGSFKEYVLQVRPNEFRADDAVAWTFGFRDAKTYRRSLEQET